MLPVFRFDSFIFPPPVSEKKKSSFRNSWLKLCCEPRNLNFLSNVSTLFLQFQYFFYTLYEEIKTAGHSLQSLHCLPLLQIFPAKRMAILRRKNIPSLVTPSLNQCPQLLSLIPACRWHLRASCYNPAECSKTPAVDAWETVSSLDIPDCRSIAAVGKINT